MKIIIAGLGKVGRILTEQHRTRPGVGRPHGQLLRLLGLGQAAAVLEYAAGPAGDLSHPHHDGASGLAQEPEEAVMQSSLVSRRTTKAPPLRAMPLSEQLSGILQHMRILSAFVE